MTWSRQEPIFPWHPKVMGLSDAAFRLCVTARDYATLMRTEGFIAERLVPRLYGSARLTKRITAAIAELTTVQPGQTHPLWEKADGGYVVHDYLDYNFGREEAEERELERTAGKAAGGRARAAGAKRVGGRFVSRATAAELADGDDAGRDAGTSSDQQPPAAAPAATSTVTVSASSNVEDNVHVNAGSPAEDHQQAPPAAASATLVDEMLDVLGDHHSAGLYRRIAVSAPEGLIFEVLGEVKYLAQMGRIRKSRGAVFTDLMKRFGRERGLDLGFGVVSHTGPPPRRLQRRVATVPPATSDAALIDGEPDAPELRAALEALRAKVPPERQVATA